MLVFRYFFLRFYDFEFDAKLESFSPEISCENFLGKKKENKIEKLLILFLLLLCRLLLLLSTHDTYHMSDDNHSRTVKCWTSHQSGNERTRGNYKPPQSTNALPVTINCLDLQDNRSAWTTDFYSKSYFAWKTHLLLTDAFFTLFLKCLYLAR